jgi:hypothetical protein
MSTPLHNPLVRHGVGVVSAAVVVAIAFTVLEGTARYVALAIAAFELVVTPQILKYAVENAETDGAAA